MTEPNLSLFSKNGWIDHLNLSLLKEGRKLRLGKLKRNHALLAGLFRPKKV
jgi:hypothetical protein